MKIYPLSLPSMLCYPLLWLFSRDRKLLALRRRWTLECAAQARGEKSLQKELEKEALIDAAIIQNALTQLGYGRMANDVHSAAGQLPGTVQKVRFHAIVATQQEILFKLLLNQRTWTGDYGAALPFGTYTGDLIDDRTIDEISMRLDRVVEARRPPDKMHGVWIVVHRTEDRGGLPLRVAFQEILEHYPADMEQGPLVLGIAQHHNIVKNKLDDCAHVLIAGATRTGKSNMLNQLICAMLVFCDPSEMQFAMIDLKRVELGAYAGDPHLWGPPAKEPAAAVDLMEKLEEEMIRRSKAMDAAGVKKLSEWNAQCSPDERWPRIILIIDELAAIMNTSDRKTATRVTALIEHTSNVGAGAGVHMILCTQMPSSDVITKTIRVNMNLIVSGKVATWRDSIIVLGQAGAEALPYIDPKGRMLVKFGSEVEPVQTPLIANDDIHWALNISRGRAAGVLTMAGLKGIEPTILEDGLLRWLAKHQIGLTAKMDGELSKLGIPDAAWREFRKDVFKRQSVIVDGVNYRIRRRKEDALLEADPGSVIPAPDEPAEAIPAPAGNGSKPPERSSGDSTAEALMATWRKRANRKEPPHDLN